MLIGINRDASMVTNCAVSTLNARNRIGETLTDALRREICHASPPSAVAF